MSNLYQSRKEMCNNICNYFEKSWYSLQVNTSRSASTQCNAELLVGLLSCHSLSLAYRTHAVPSYFRFSELIILFIFVF